MMHAYGTFGQRRNVWRILFIVFGIFCLLQFNLTPRSMPHFIHFVCFLLALSPLESLLIRFSSGFKIKTTLRHLRSDSVIHTTCINCFNEQKTLSFAKHPSLSLSLQFNGNFLESFAANANVSGAKTCEPTAECVKNGETETSSAQINN